ncbi:MAG: type II toxin-antitoxin system HicA family toxin [Pseudomonadales bacterium]|nr:type II toxin-antitoxin system HicA family toxin [Pseudomonadales bacterium]
MLKLGGLDLTAGKKVLEKLKENKKSNLTWRELCALLKHLGYEQRNATGGGASTKFVHPITNRIHHFHRPHPGDEVPAGARRDLVSKLYETGELK